MIDSSLEVLSWSGGRLLLACDEAGYGCTAGSMFVAGVSFPPDFNFSQLKGLNDSKKMSESQRFAMEEKVIASAHLLFCAEVTPPQIDAGSPYYLRFSVAEAEIFKMKGLSKIDVVMDGNVALKITGANSTSCLIKGDSKCLSIAAASVIAKCAKDRQMISLDKEYPMYGWASNKGYESSGHRDAILKHGLSPYHRRSYCKKYLGAPCI